MFNLAVSDANKEYYVGTVTRQVPTALEIEGDDFAEDHITVVRHCLQLRLSPDAQKKCENVSPGDKIVVGAYKTKNPLLAYADEVAEKNEVIRLKSKDGYDKLLIIGYIAGIRWGLTKKRLEVSFMNLKNPDGGYYGIEKQFNRVPYYWTNINYFPKVKDKDDIYSADRVERELHKGDLVAMTVNIKVNSQRGMYFINHNGAKYTILAKAQ